MKPKLLAIVLITGFILTETIQWLIIGVGVRHGVKWFRKR